MGGRGYTEEGVLRADPQAVQLARGFDAEEPCRFFPVLTLRLRAFCRSFAVKGAGCSWRLEVVMPSCGHARGHIPHLARLSCTCAELAAARGCGFSSALRPLPSCSRPAGGLGCCWGERVSRAPLRLAVQLRPQNKTSLSRVSEQPRG